MTCRHPLFWQKGDVITTVSEQGGRRTFRLASRPVFDGCIVFFGTFVGDRRRTQAQVSVPFVDVVGMLRFLRWTPTRHKSINEIRARSWFLKPFRGRKFGVALIVARGRGR